MSVTPRRRLVLALIIGAALVTSGCAAVAGDRATVLPTDGSSRSEAPSVPPVPSASSSPIPNASSTTAPATPEGVTACAGAPVTLGGADLDLVLTGDCPSVTISGTDLDIDTTGAVVGAITVNGDRNDLDAADIANLTVGGQQNEIGAERIDALTINGDRNETTVRGALGATTVSGNDNAVTAAQVGAVTDNGQRNRVAGS